MMEVDLQRDPARRYLREQLLPRQLKRPLESLVAVPRRQRERRMGDPVEIAGCFAFAPVEDLVVREGLRYFQVSSLGIDPGEKLVRETVVQRDAASPRIRAVEVVEELVEAGDLRRFQRLAREEPPLQGAKARHPQRRRRSKSPCQTQLRIGLRFRAPKLIRRVQMVDAHAQMQLQRVIQ